MSVVADPFYLATGITAALLVCLLAAGFTGNHGGDIARLWARACELVAAALVRLRMTTDRLLLAAAAVWLSARLHLHAVSGGSHKHRRTPGGIYR